MIENFLDTGLQLKQILPTSPIEVAVDCLQKIPLSKGDSPFTIYHNQVNFLEYGIGVHYFSPNTCKIDEETGIRTKNNTLFPQGWREKQFPERSDFKVFKACDQTPIEIYSFSGNINDVVKYFSMKDRVPYDLVHSLSLEKPIGYWDEQLGTREFFGKTILSGLENKTLQVFERNGGGGDGRFVDLHNFSFHRILIYNPSIPNHILKIEHSGSDCIVYPQIAIFEVF